MFGTVVLDVADEAFEHPMHEYKAQEGLQTRYRNDCRRLEGSGRDLQGSLTRRKQALISHRMLTNNLTLATEAVFQSWNGKRAIDYRNKEGISHDLGTAVNICTMVFGNMGDDSATGVAFTRNPSTGDNKMMGEYLLNAQGEDVVAGIRNADPIEHLARPDAQGLQAVHGHHRQTRKALQGYAGC